jgi:hypothetical protein
MEAFDMTEMDDELYSLINRTDKECASCGEPIHYTDEVFLLSVVRPIISVEGVLYEMMQAEDGDFLYEPRILSLECWEELEETLREWVADQPPILDPRSVLECSACESGIQQGETLGLVQFGEVHCSQRTPDGVPTSIFESYDNDPKNVCIACLRLLNSELCNLWDGTVQQGTECKEGTSIRCWRNGCQGQELCFNDISKWDIA